MKWEVSNSGRGVRGVAGAWAGRSIVSNLSCAGLGGGGGFSQSQLVMDSRGSSFLQPWWQAASHHLNISLLLTSNSCHMFCRRYWRFARFLIRSGSRLTWMFNVNVKTSDLFLQFLDACLFKALFFAVLLFILIVVKRNGCAETIIM